MRGIPVTLLVVPVIMRVLVIAIAFAVGCVSGERQGFAKWIAELSAGLIRDLGAVGGSAEGRGRRDGAKCPRCRRS